MGKNKGQSAKEYLMVYGWAILIVIVVVGALFVMGVFGEGDLDYENVCRNVCESKGLKYYDWYGDPVCKCLPPCETMTVGESEYEVCDYDWSGDDYIRFRIENITEIEHSDYCEIECGC